MKRSHAYPLLFTLLLLAGLLAAYFAFPSLQQELRRAFELARAGKGEALARWFQQFGIWGPVGIVVFMIAQMFLIIVPSWLLMIVANIGYGAVWGVVISVLAVSAASTIGYLLGRFFSQAVVGRLFSRDQERKMEQLVRRYGFGIVVLFRLSPLLSTDGISIVAGVLRMPYWRYLLATLLGITPLAMAIAYFAQDLDKLKSGLYWLGGAGLLLYGLYVWLDYRRRSQSN
jgi:uncharacterized membrane protein YdjX (TVP38/TMEM64 family)